jgi:hypothetical protein
VKKISKRRNSPETSTTMALGRIFAVHPEGTKRMLEVDKAPTGRVTRKKAKENTAINNDQGSLHKDVESLLHKDVEGTPHRDVEGTPHRDASYHSCMKEALTTCSSALPHLMLTLMKNLTSQWVMNAKADQRAWF